MGASTICGADQGIRQGFGGIEGDWGGQLRSAGVIRFCGRGVMYQKSSGIEGNAGYLGL